MATRMREKAVVRRENADRRPRAIARYIRISSRKVKVVIDLIRGKRVADAEAILMHTPKAPQSRCSSSCALPWPTRRTMRALTPTSCM